MNTINWTSKAARQLRMIADKPMQKRIYAETQTLADFPNCAHISGLSLPASDGRLARVFHVQRSGVHCFYRGGEETE